MAFFKFDPNEDDEARAEKMRGFFSPNQVDQLIRNSIQMLWMVLPKEKRNVDEVERQVRRVVDRALRDLREDFDNFFGKQDK